MINLQTYKYDYMGWTEIIILGTINSDVLGMLNIWICHKNILFKVKSASEPASKSKGFQEVSNLKVKLDSPLLYGYFSKGTPVKGFLAWWAVLSDLIRSDRDLASRHFL